MKKQQLALKHSEGKLAILIPFSVKSILLGLYVVAVFLSFSLSSLKYQSLGFHTRDYAFYLQFAAKLFDPNLSKVYSLNPEGRNMFFMHGVEGNKNFHQTLHFELIKYFYAVLYQLNKDPRILFLFTSAVFYFPLLYLALIGLKANGVRNSLALVLGIFYVLYPASLEVPSYDLRPFIFLAPFYFVLVLSIHLRRPWWETLLWFNALFFIREEALLFNLGILLYLAYCQEHEPHHKITIKYCLLSWFVWIIIILFFFTWTGYPSDLIEEFLKITDQIPMKSFLRLWIFLIGISVLFFASIAGLWLFMQRKLAFIQNSPVLSIRIAIYSSIFVPLIYQFIKNESLYLTNPTNEWVLSLIFSPKYFLYFIVVLGLWVIVSKYQGLNTNKRNKRIGNLALIILCFLFVISNIFFPQGFLDQYSKNSIEAKTAQMIWEMRKKTNQYQNHLLVDYKTHQAFYDYQFVYAYNRLPWYLKSGKNRYFPNNSAIVQRLIDSQIEYVIISTDSLSTVENFLQKSKVSSEKILNNEGYVVFQIFR